MRPRCTLALAVLMIALTPSLAPAGEPVDIGARLELFVDGRLIDRITGQASLHLQKPQPQQVVLTTDKPWEGNTSAYYTIFQDGDLYRMYYRGSHWDVQAKRATHDEVTCYAESRDGIHWTKPELGLFEFDGSKANNIVWDGIGTHCFTPFMDANPDCPAEARYKAIARGRPRGKKGLYVFQSPDGIHWSLMHPEPVITNGDFDSQNLAFWDPVRQLYVDYHRKGRDGRRDIVTAISPDLLHWTEPVYLEYPDAPKEHLYTNAIRAYPRAPHLKIGFPTRFDPDTQQVEPTFMAGRDGRTFRRWTDAVIPHTAPSDRDGNRSNYMTNGLVQLPGDDKHFSVYATEAYYTGPDSRVRRFTYRVDGFVSVRADARGGQLITKPLRFKGRELVLNYTTRNGGTVRVELQRPDGTAVDGFTLADCRPLCGDAIAETVTWNGEKTVETLAETPIRLRFSLQNADVFSFVFRD